MTINLRGRLLDLSSPIVMGIINATPDSFYAGSRVDADAAVTLAERHLREGAAILDVGACSTRPGSQTVTAEEEQRRLDAVLPLLRSHFPDAVISLDTFRASVVRHCAERYSIDIINDVTAATLDPSILQAAADLHLPYILTHGYSPSVPVATFFAERLEALHALGIADVILDPGIGFGKTRAEDFAILRDLPALIRLFPDNPWLIGLSRKRIVHETLAVAPDSPSALSGTTILNTAALLAGAHILRVHDVLPAAEAVILSEKLKEK